MKLLLLFPVIALSACSSVLIGDQAQLSKPEMNFGETGARSMDCALTSQLEKGLSLSNASAAGGCYSCH